ncbi:MAG: hypothetical protein HQM12_14100 [SAR324 cluster bacterium]|nr:hypothetical protein [SAR324 cluster bacterium]
MGEDDKVADGHQQVSLTLSTNTSSDTVYAALSSSTATVTNTDRGALAWGTYQGTPLSLIGTVSTLAGTGRLGVDNGIGTSASFNRPAGITIVGDNLYVADYENHAIRQINIDTGVVTTLAGTVGTSGNQDGTGTAALFASPIGITTDGTNLYVSEYSSKKIRKIVISTGVVQTLMTTSTSQGLRCLVTDGTNIYGADEYGHRIIKIVIATTTQTTLAGEGTSGHVDGTGTAAKFVNPWCLTSDGTALYVTSSYGHTVRKVIIATGVVTTIAGTNSLTGSTDGTGTSARFYYPLGIVTDGTNLYVVDSNNHNIRKIVISSGVVTTLAGSAQSSGFTNGTGTTAQFHIPNGIVSNGKYLFVTDEYNYAIRKIQ